MAKTIQDVLALIQEQGIKMVDFKMVDINGQFRHVTIPAKNFDESVMRNGIGFDASNYGYAVVEKSDMAKKKPTWADGSKSAEEYLKSHPNAVVDHLTKMQDEEMMKLYDTLAEYLTDTQLYYFRSRIEQAYASDNYQPGEGRTRRGKNDAV